MDTPGFLAWRAVLSIQVAGCVLNKMKEAAETYLHKPFKKSSNLDLAGDRMAIQHIREAAEKAKSCLSL